eukprot:Skav231314  [mRNA]  locus=scaffold1116:48362:54053:- [translate_table: standard]
MPAPVQVGDLVQIFNSATDSFDQEGVVSQVLSSPQAYGSSVLPAGSVAVSSVDGSRTMWISEEHVGAMVRKAEKVLMMDDYTPLHDMDSPTTSTPDHGRASCTRMSFGDALTEDQQVQLKQWTSGYANYANANASINSMIGAVSSFFGLSKDAPAIGDSQADESDSDSEEAHMANVQLLQLDCCLNYTAMENEDDGGHHFAVEFSCESVVDLWSYENLEWELGGTVTQVLSAPLTLVSMELPAGSVLVSMKGTLRRLGNSWITPELCSLAVRRSELPKPPKADEDLHFQEGDEVEMRDVHGAWQPALVTAVASFNSDSVPAGSLTVCRQGDAQSCTIIPDMFGKMVRKPVNGVGRKSTDGGSAKDDLEDKEQWNPDTYLQANPDNDDGLVGKVSSTASSCKVDDSAGTRCQSNPDEIQRSPSSPSSTSRSRADPPDTAAVSPPVVSKTPSDGIPGTNPLGAKTSADASDEETSGVSKSAIQVVRADSGDKQDDSMSKSPSDGTTASGHQTPRPSVTATPMSASPCASPASCPQPAPRHANFLDLDERPPSPAGSIHSVHPTVSLRIPDLDDRPQSRPNSPCPAYNRAEQRVLVVGAGFGRELNPQQGQLLDSAGFQVKWVHNLPNPETPCFPIAQFLPVLKQAIDEFEPHLLICASKGGAYATGLWKAGMWDGPTLLINRHPSLTELPKGNVVVLAHGSNDEYYKFLREDLEKLVRSGTPNKCYLHYTANSGILGRGYTRQGDRHNMEPLELQAPKVGTSTRSLKQWDTLPRLCDAAMSMESPELQL